MTARRVCTGVFVVACLAAAARSDAGSVTFLMDCAVQNTSPATCPVTGSWGTLTLSDSVVNPNRVDVFMSIAQPLPAGVTGIEKIFLNYNGAIAAGGAVDRRFGLVDQSAAAGDHTSLGDVDLDFDSLGPFETTLDLAIDPDGNPGDTFLGSLALYSTLAGHAEFDLDVSMFRLLDADSLLCAAFTTLPGNQRYEFGARGCGEDVAAVPEPATLTLVGISLGGLATILRRTGRRGAR